MYTYMHAYVRTYVRTYIHTYIYREREMYYDTSIHINIYICIYTHTVDLRMPHPSQVRIPDAQGPGSWHILSYKRPLKAASSQGLGSFFPD